MNYVITHSKKAVESELYLKTPLFYSLEGLYYIGEEEMLLIGLHVIRVLKQDKGLFISLGKVGDWGKDYEMIRSQNFPETTEQVMIGSAADCQFQLESGCSH